MVTPSAGQRHKVYYSYNLSGDLLTMLQCLAGALSLQLGDVVYAAAVVSQRLRKVA